MLRDLGYAKGVVFETIVSTFNEKQQPNAAPMGTMMENDQQITIKVYNTSSTLKNLTANKCAVINVTSNIDLFYKSAFKETNPKRKLPNDWFEKARTVNAPRLKSAVASIEVAVINLKPVDSERTEATFNVNFIEARAVLPQVYCRAFSATVEAIIHATRVKAYVSGTPKQKNQAQKLLETIAICQDVVNRTAPNSRYTEIMTELTKQVNSWRSNR